MSLSRHLQTSGLFDTIAGMSSENLREVVLEIGRSWYNDHPDEREVIADNLRRFNLDSSPEAVDLVQHHTILHYFEKFLPLSGSIATYADFLHTAIDAGHAVEQLRQSISREHGICIALSHFGAVEFITPFLASHHFPVNTVLKFSTETFSAAAHERSAALRESGLFSYVNLVEIGKPKTMAAMEMAAVLRRREILMSVFDEKTPYSKPAELFGTSVWGGAGLDRMIAFANTPVDLYSAFMVRGDDGRYRFELYAISDQEPDQIAALYRILESVVREHPHQWYFLHEELPFISEPAENR